jgi:hypothetical protein
MAGDKPLPAAQEYGLGNVGFVKLMPDGTAHFWLGDADSLDHGSAITSEHLLIMRKIVKHLERGGF